MPIQLLTTETIGKIAAGEVVERPASVVKELLENALDAGARRISVEIRNGSSDLIEVVDDGPGMSPEDLAAAIQRHATSKLSAFEDLDTLRTLGFRGEALPSIAAVASVLIASRTADAPVGSEVRVDFGAVGPVDMAAIPMGTRVSVRDLFANVPARRKFLRQASTEVGYATRVVSSYAAAYTGVAVTLTVDGRRVFGTDGSGDDVAAATGVYGPEVGQAALRLVPLDEAAAVPGVTVTGWVGAPAVTRSHRNGLVFFVNGRWIQSRALSFALEEAYHSLLMVGRHPVAVVHVALDPATVDVNVHPTKAEVKFVDERAVCRAVQRAAHAALLGAPQDALPRVQFAASAWQTEQRPMDLPRPRWGPDPDTGRETASAGDPAPEDEKHASGVPILRVLGQVGGTYIIAEGPQGMYLIDQHAAHERVLYEKILAQISGRMADKQPLLDPLIVDLSPEELGIYERSAEELAQIGFDVEPFGEGSVAIRAVPAMMRNVDVTERLRLILKELVEGGAGDSWLDSVAISTACHTSIRAGQPLSLPEMRELVAELERSSQPRACGHGRPTMLHMAQADLERQFSRR
ncbi:MAG: DNA mismatch repair endonuclease MutL [Chloroflexota bacterium]|nr:DNA mismatch repair endonuclease MutL [Chloroflexota bacterium]